MLDQILQKTPLHSARDVNNVQGERKITWNISSSLFIPWKAAKCKVATVTYLQNYNPKTAGNNHINLMVPTSGSGCLL